MDLYDVMAEGCHTPLTSREIAELFEAGQFNRHQPCRPLGKTTWRTIDELFPLLKYGQRAPSFDSDDPPEQRPVWPIALATALLVLLLSGSAVYFWSQYSSGVPIVLQSPPPVLPVVARMTPSPRSDSRPVHSAPMSFRKESTNTERLIAEKRQREQTAREQAALADQKQLNAERERQEAERAAGTDYRVPLDQDFLIRDRSGLSVRVRVHDNDVTSFDIWIHGAHYREIKKQKGITHSGTDEAFVYRSGRASLYYVWELSGALNHCMLRVREN